MKKVFVVIIIIGFRRLYSLPTQQDCPNYGQVKTEQTRS